MGKYKAMSEWLSGLALDIPFYYEDIIKLAVDMGSIDENPSDKLKSKVQENYFDFLMNLIQLYVVHYLLEGGVTGLPLAFAL